MKIKSLILGSAAAMIAISGAEAADLPVADPVDYVRICDTFGTGFFYIPGTETCLRISGYVRAELRYNSPWWDMNAGGIDLVAGAVGTNNSHNFTNTHARADVRFDARTMTEYGLLRSFIELRFHANSGAGFAAASRVDLYRGFIQFGGLTAGRAQSFFDFFVDFANEFGSNQGLAYNDPATNLFAYTFAFGNGFSATLSLEDGTMRRGALRWDPGDAVVQFGAYGGHAMPDIVAALRVDQGWGSAQIAGAVHEIRTRTPVIDTAYGWAVMGGLAINLPMIGEGDSFAIQGVYSDGAQNYAGTGGSRFAAANAIWASTSTGARPVMGPIDALETGTTLQTTKAWSVVGTFVHNWTPQFATAISASYLDYDEATDTTGYNMDFTAWSVVGTATYQPVNGLLFGLEVAYENTDTNQITGAPGPFVALAPGQAIDSETWAGVFRIQRNF